MGVRWEFAACRLSGMTREKFRGLSDRERIGWRCYAELEHYLAHPGQIPTG